MTLEVTFALAPREPAMAAVPSRFNRYGEPVFERIRQPARGSERCEECGGTGVAWAWIDTASGEQLDEPENAGFGEDGQPVADGYTADGTPIPGGAHLRTSTCEACEGDAWFPAQPKRPPAKPRPGRDWTRCASCEGRGGSYSEIETRPWWAWTPCGDCSTAPEGDYTTDGLGWSAPMTDEELAAQEAASVAHREEFELGHLAVWHANGEGPGAGCGWNLCRVIRGQVTAEQAARWFAEASAAAGVQAGVTYLCPGDGCTEMVTGLFVNDAGEATCRDHGHLSRRR